MCVCGGGSIVRVSAGAQAGYKHQIPLELELQVIVGAENCPLREQHRLLNSEPPLLPPTVGSYS